MDLEILHAHPRARRVQFAGTIVASETGQVLELDVGWGREGRVDGVAGGGVGEDVDGGVLHHRLEGVARVAGLEGGERGGEPEGWGWLDGRNGGVSGVGFGEKRRPGLKPNVEGMVHLPVDCRAPVGTGRRRARTVALGC